MIDISTDAFSNETYKKIRVGGNLDITRSNILKLIDLKKQALIQKRLQTFKNCLFQMLKL